MNDYKLEHPDVTAAERTGYARGHEPLVFCSCSECGEPIYYGDYAVRVTGFGWICTDCVNDCVAFCFIEEGTK